MERKVESKVTPNLMLNLMICIIIMMDERGMMKLYLEIVWGQSFDIELFIGCI